MAALRIALAAALAAVFAVAGRAAVDAPVDFTVENASSIPEPLIALPPGARGGGGFVFDRAGCADCHKTPDRPDAPAIGPDLSDVGARLTEGEIRLMIVDPRISSPRTEMPAYYAVGVFDDAPDELVGRTRLSAADVERLVELLVAYDGEDGSN
ncbi:MAG: hypothetical protein AAF322_05870 [Pseudomonadota bacterium]